jgi:hypothetical protein
MSRRFVFVFMFLLASAAEASEPVLRAACDVRAELERAGAALAAGERARAERELRRAEERRAACRVAARRAGPAYVRANGVAPGRDARSRPVEP